MPTTGPPLRLVPATGGDIAALAAMSESTHAATLASPAFPATPQALGVGGTSTDVGATRTIEGMTGAVPRPELDAKLDGLRQEMRASAADLRADFARLSESLIQSASGLREGIAEVRGSVAEVRGSVDGLKSLISMLQWTIGTVGLAAGIVIAYLQLKQAEAPTAPQMPSITVNVPAPQAATPPVPAASR